MKGSDMQIGIIGAGFIARAVAAVATRHGHEVMVSNTRGPDTLFSLIGTIGCRAGTPQEAAVFGDIALLAIPLNAYGATPRRAPVLSTPVTPCVRKETQ
jgi:predicted dinucleotide-binding enzyme